MRKRKATVPAGTTDAAIAAAERVNDALRKMKLHGDISVVPSGEELHVQLSFRMEPTGEDEPRIQVTDSLTEIEITRTVLDMVLDNQAGMLEVYVMLREDVAKKSDDNEELERIDGRMTSIIRDLSKILIAADKAGLQLADSARIRKLIE